MLPWPLPWSDDLHIHTWPVSRADFQVDEKWTSCVMAIEHYRITYIHTDRQTDRQTDRHWPTYKQMPPKTLPDRFAGGKNNVLSVGMKFSRAPPGIPWLQHWLKRCMAKLSRQRRTATYNRRDMPRNLTYLLTYLLTGRCLPCSGTD